jgi:2-amino-4-hydroxy-6-hydroxymethyldihydropteridine diphosphokinase
MTQYDNFLDNGYLRSTIVAMEKTYLLLGTNVGDLEENMARAFRAIAAQNIKILKKSKIYKTKPWGVYDQPDYLNLALEVESDFSAAELLGIFKRIESQMGRRKTKKKWQPRLIDIDILFWGKHVIDHADLKIPHEQFYNRPFAIKILSEIAPDFIPPGRKETLSELCAGEDNEGVEVYRD